MHKILILTSGNVSKLDGFSDLVDKGSFADINFDSGSKDLKSSFAIRFKNNDLKTYKLIYFRMVGKSLEIATLVVDYAKQNGIQIVDRMYETAHLLPISLGKALEMRKLQEKGIPIPKTVFGSFDGIDFPYIVKSTTGQKSREVWLVNNLKELELLRSKIDNNKLYFIQELIANARRIRVLVVGDKAIGAIARQTKWNKDETKETLKIIPEDIQKLALESAKTVDLDICGIDILVDSKTNEKYVIEANAAPAWKLINKYCGVIVEDEIIKYLSKQI
ncbi:MAG: ATP-grasp domain-containing protein [Candidatus Woesebacteria bacterium]|nr:ATP-grasp domain-containing protein [Candidatus Woesebacteria bacterium]